MHSDLGYIVSTARSPLSLRRAVLDLRAADRRTFLQSASDLATHLFHPADGLKLIEQLVASGLVEYIAGDPEILGKDDAERLVREAMRLDSTLPVKLAQHVLQEDPSIHLDAKFRLLEILGAILEGSKAAMAIAALLSRAEPRLRSRAALALGCHVAQPSWIRDQLQHEDPRVRANAIESLWSQVSAHYEGVLRHAALDPHNRVRGNALYGLYLLGAAGVKDQILAMSQHPDPAFRTTAAWVMGQCGDQGFIPELEDMIRNDRGSTRMSALRALARLRAQEKPRCEPAAARPKPPGPA